MQEINSNKGDSLQTQISDIQDFTDEHLNNFLDLITPEEELIFNATVNLMDILDMKSWRPRGYKTS